MKKIILTEIMYLLWSIAPALLIGYGTHNYLLGIGVMIIMFFLTSLDRDLKKLLKKI